MKIILRNGMAYFAEVHDIPMQDTVVEIVQHDQNSGCRAISAKVNDLPSVAVRENKFTIPATAFLKDKIKVDIVVEEALGSKSIYNMDEVVLRRIVVFGGDAFDAQPQSIKILKQKLELLESELTEHKRANQKSFEAVDQRIDDALTKGDII